jgi:phosphoribosylamine--glycine ligase
MPPGVPVATVSIGKSGARNAAILAAQIMSTDDPRLAEELDGFKKDMAESVNKKAAKLAAEN